MGFVEVAADPPASGEVRAGNMLSIVQEMRTLRDSLPPRPSSAAIADAERAISAIEHRLIDQLAAVTQGTRPYGVQPGWFLALQAMREDRCRRDAEMEKRPHLAVVELEQFYRHYDSIIVQAERAIFGGEDGPTGIANSLRVGAAPRIIDYTEGSEGSVVATRGGLSTGNSVQNLEGKSVGESVSGTPRSVLAEGAIFGEGGSRQSVPPPRAGGLSAALRQGSGLPDLTTIEENKDGDNLPPKLLAMIEDAVVDKRTVFDVSETFGSLTWLPETLGALDSLTHLNLSQNRLLFLPSSIGNLTNLRKLDLQGNQLITLPETIGNLEYLVHLDFHGNKLDELPVSIGGCASLVELAGDFNNLRGLPESLGQCTNLEKASFALNQLKRLPRTIGNLVNLTELDLHYNQLEVLPEGLCNLTSLTTLNIAAQHFNLHELPFNIGQLQSLTEFNMSECYIKVLPPSFVHLTNLTILKLDGNPFTDPPLDVASQGREAVMEYLQLKASRSDGSRGSKGLQARDIEIKSGLRRFFHKGSPGGAPSIIGRRKSGPSSVGSGGFFLGSMGSAGGGGGGFFKSQGSEHSDTLSDSHSPPS